MDEIIRDAAGRSAAERAEHLPDPPTLDVDELRDQLLVEQAFIESGANVDPKWEEFVETALALVNQYLDREK